MFVKAKPVTQTLLDSNWDDGDDGNYNISGVIRIRSKGWSPGWMPKSQNVQATSYCTRSHLLNLKIIWKRAGFSSIFHFWILAATSLKNNSLWSGAWSVLDPFEAKPHGFRKRVDDEDLPFWFWLSVGKAMEKTENPMVFFAFLTFIIFIKNSIFVNENFPDWHNLTYEGFDS